MIQYGLRQAKRFAVLIPGIIIAYFSVRDIFPYFHRRLPQALAILVTYVIAAYMLVPAAIRLFRILRPPAHLPLYCVTPDGFASDPVNVGIICTRRELITAMETAGWYVADPHTARHILRQILTTVLGGSYNNAPVSNLYLFGRRQDIAFEIPVDGSASNRHHVRFWATTYSDQKPLTVRSIRWHHRRAYVKSSGNLLWVGSASLDVGINFIRHNMQLTHMIAPDTNKERELIVEQLRGQRLVKKVEMIKLGKPYRLINRVWTGSLQTDGKMAIVSLRDKNKLST